jgi:hypothetical protein
MEDVLCQVFDSSTKETSLSLCEFRGCRALFIVVGHGIDPNAYGIAPHQPGITGLQ